MLSRSGEQARYADQQQDQPSLGGVCCNWASSMISIGALGLPATAVTAPMTRACGRFDSGTTQMHSICQARQWAVCLRGWARMWKRMGGWATCYGRVFRTETEVVCHLRRGRRQAARRGAPSQRAASRSACWTATASARCRLRCFPQSAPPARMSMPRPWFSRANYTTRSTAVCSAQPAPPAMLHRSLLSVTVDVQPPPFTTGDCGLEGGDPPS